MLRQSIFTAAILLAFTMNASPEEKDNPIANYISEEIETLELELELFGTPNNDDIISIASVYVYEPEEVIELDFNTTSYLPESFNPRKGMHDIDWSSVDLYEIEEEVTLDFDTKKHLPKDFNPYKGMSAKTSKDYCFLK